MCIRPLSFIINPAICPSHSLSLYSTRRPFSPSPPRLISTTPFFTAYKEYCMNLSCACPDSVKPTAEVGITTQPKSKHQTPSGPRDYSDFLMQSPLSDTNTPFSPVQSPPPPPPPTPTTTTGALRRTTISFGATEPPRHRYDILSDALAAVQGNALPGPGPALAAVLQTPPSRQDSRRTRLPPRRLSIRTQSSRSTPSWLPKTPLYAPPLTPLHSLLSPSYPLLVTNDKYYTSWEVQYSFSLKESRVHGSFALVVFLGPPRLPESGIGIEDWVTRLEATGCRVGGHGISGGGSGVEGQGVGEVEGNVEGTIPLTKALIERIDEVGGRLDAERVLPYLRQKLHYVVEKADGGVVSLRTLEVRIVSSLADIEEPGSRSDQKPFDTVYGGGIGRVR
ncbi:hypothetical protein EV426DRAFT_424497 [Tirmania nivea]|nr:hypothetical protein EV426DRAFT_424497 [Tirmania nivea]